ncbi:MAG: substrate-binding domain-containing protein, partial [Bacillota bacterium]|nr:substrate-binding domain-containing protein [Bacillota bacterium]
ISDIRQINLADGPEAIVREIHLAVLVDESTPEPFNRGIVEAAREHMLVAELLTVSEDNVAEVFKQVELTGVDGVIIRLNNHTILNEEIESLKEAGMVVVLIGNDAPESTRDVYIGTNGYQQGKAMGEMVMDVLGGEGRIALLLGSEMAEEQSASRINFVSGIYETLNQPESGVHIAGEFSTTARRAELITDDLLSNDIRIGALICTDSVDVHRAIRVLVDRNAVGRVAVLARGTEEEMANYLQQEMVYGLIVEDHYAIAQIAIESIELMISGFWISSYVNVPFDVITNW